MSGRHLCNGFPNVPIIPSMENVSQHPHYFPISFGLCSNVQIIWDFQYTVVVNLRLPSVKTKDLNKIVGENSFCLMGCPRYARTIDRRNRELSQCEMLGNFQESFCMFIGIISDFDVMDTV